MNSLFDYIIAGTYYSEEDSIVLAALGRQELSDLNDSDNLQKSFDSGIAGEHRLNDESNSGAMNKGIYHIQFNDGTHGIRKNINENDLSRELLVPKVAKAIGAYTPATINDSDDRPNSSIIMRRAPGLTGMAHKREHPEEYNIPNPKYPRDPDMNIHKAYTSPSALKLSLVDSLVNNSDRHNGNFLIHPNNKDVIGIDHGISFESKYGGGFPSHDNLYPSRYLGNIGKPHSMDLLNRVGPKLNDPKLAQAFSDQDHNDWYDTMMKRYENLRKDSSGSGNF